MNIHTSRPFDPVGGTETPESIGLDRRKWMRRTAAAAVTMAGAGALGWWWYRGTDEQVLASGDVGRSDGPFFRQFPAAHDERFTYGRPETAREAAARYTNFYEFSSLKSGWRFVDDFKPHPWTLTVTGLVDRPGTWDLDELTKLVARDVCERQYRHRCVERWAMAIPWSGFPLASLLRHVGPTARATHVRFVAMHRPEEAPQQRLRTSFPWPYTEGLTLAEAMHDLTFIATGMYGEPLLKQHGAPLRLVVPWKYGYKSIKSIERIELVDEEPATFWSTLNPDAYPFESNVDPRVPRPWDQSQEWMLGSQEVFATQWLNGYAEFVGDLYPRRPA